MTIYLRWISDGGLVKRTLSGNRDAFGVLVERHLAMAHALAWGQTGNPADADDIAQDAFVKAFTKLDTLREGEKFAGWLAGIVRNRAADLRLRAQRAEPLDMAAAAQLPAPARHPEDEEIYALLRDAVLNLEEPAREVLTLHYFAQKPLREVAQLQGISREAANKRLQRAREALGKQLLSKLEAAPKPSQRLAARKSAILAALAATPFAWKAAAATGLSAGAIATAAGVIAVLGALGVAGYEFGSERFARFFQAAPADAAGHTAPRADAAASAAAGASPADTVLAANPTTEDPGKGRIWGKVMDVNGNPVPKATVRIELVDWKPEMVPPNDSKRFEVVSNPDGTYELTGLPWGAYSILAFGGNAVDVLHSRVDSEISQREEDLYLKPGLPITGRVVTSAGAPVPNVVLQPYLYEPMGVIDDYVASAAVRAVSDSEGRFRIGLLWPGSWQFLARVDGFAPTVSGMIEAGNQSAQVTLLGGGKVTGRLLRAGSLVPVAGLTVRLKGDGPAALAPWAMSADDGSFEMTNVAPGRYTPALDSETAVIKAPGDKVVVEAGSETALELIIGGGGTVSGRVYDTDTNEGVPRTRVRIQSALAGDVYRDVLTDAVGSFFFPILPDGGYRLDTDGDGGYFPVNPDGSLLVIVSNEREVDIAIPVKRGVKLSGTVVDPDGAPVEGAYLTAKSVRFGSMQTEYTSSSSEDDGRFDMWIRDPRAAVTLVASREGLASDPLKLPEAGAQGRSGLVLRVGRLAQGRVELKMSTEGLEKELAVQLVEASLVSTSDTPGLGSSERVAPNGVALFTNVLPGTYQIQVNNRNYGMSYCLSEEFTVPPGERTVKVAVECAEVGKGTVSGVVVAEDGGPISEARVMAYGSFGMAKSATTDAQGRFVIEEVSKSMRSVSASADGYMSRSASVVADGPEVELQLSRGEVIHGQVIDADTGAPVPAYSLLYACRGDRTGGADTYSGKVNMEGSTDGKFGLSVPVDSVTELRVLAKGYLTGRATIERPEEEAVVRLERGNAVSGVVTTPDGQALSGVLISTALVRRYEDPGKINSTTTDLNGAFSMENLAPGMDLYLTHPSFPATRRVVPAGGPMNVSMGAGAVFSGRVTPWPQPGARVEVEAHDFDGGDTAWAMVGDDGSFRMERLPEGPATVRLNLAIGEPDSPSVYYTVSESAEVVLADGQETSYTFRVRTPEEIPAVAAEAAEDVGPDALGDADDAQEDAPASDESP